MRYCVAVVRDEHQRVIKTLRAEDMGEDQNMFLQDALMFVLQGYRVEIYLD